MNGYSTLLHQGWTQRGCSRGGGGGGGGTWSRRLEASGASRERVESMRGGGIPCSLDGGPGVLPQIFFKIYVSENAFQAILKPFSPYSITSILSKVRHLNPGGGGGGYSDIFICIRRLGLIFGVLKF